MSGGSAQTQSIKEPYGASEIALFGPFIASATIPYTIALKDSSCMDSVNDSVVVP